MLSPKETWNLNSSKTFCNNNLVLDITQGYFHSFCWTHLVTWFPRLSRRPLISRQTLRTHTQKNIFQKLFRTRSNQTPWTVLKLSVLLQCLKNITHREAIFTWRSLLSSVSCNTLLEDKHFCVINSNNNNKKKGLSKKFLKNSNQTLTGGPGGPAGPTSPSFPGGPCGQSHTYKSCRLHTWWGSTPSSPSSLRSV